MFYFLGILSIITGLFKAFVIMYLIVFIHELGHITMSLIFNWNIKKINVYPFGGYIIFDDIINKPFIEEVLVFASGILFQIILFIIFTLIIDNNSYIYKLFYNYNITILIFNLIPVIPLDGGKILNIILNYIYPFKASHLLTILTSYLIVILLIIYNYKNINMILICILMLSILIKEHKNHLYIYNSFLIERYLNKSNYKKNNIINKINLRFMKKYKNNVFLKNGIYYDEYEILNKKYSNKQKKID